MFRLQSESIASEGLLQPHILAAAAPAGWALFAPPVSIAEALQQHLRARHCLERRAALPPHASSPAKRVSAADRGLPSQARSPRFRTRPRKRSISTAKTVLSACIGCLPLASHAPPEPGAGLQIGPVKVGSEHKIALQTMTTTDTRDVEGTVDQVRGLPGAPALEHAAPACGSPLQHGGHVPAAQRGGGFGRRAARQPRSPPC